MRNPLGMPAIGRRAFIQTSVVMAAAAAVPTMAFADDDLSLEMLLRDPAAPVTGNPQGNLTMVAFLDYNCPWCKKAAVPMHDAVAKDGQVRLVYKDWPIITKDSETGARMALAAKYQDRYDAAHEALMAIKTPKVKAAEMVETLRNTKAIDFARLEGDLRTHDAEISTLLERNYKQAMSLNLNGTPAFIFGKYLVPGAIQTVDEFASLFAKARQPA
jgi:protein-disulfide isomerase